MNSKVPKSLSRKQSKPEQFDSINLSTIQHKKNENDDQRGFLATDQERLKNLLSIMRSTIAVFNQAPPLPHAQAAIYKNDRKAMHKAPSSSQRSITPTPVTEKLRRSRSGFQTQPNGPESCLKRYLEEEIIQNNQGTMHTEDYYGSKNQTVRHNYCEESDATVCRTSRNSIPKVTKEEALPRS